MYQILQEEEGIDHSCCRTWERDLGRPIDIEDWQNASACILDLSVNIAIREAYLKVRHCWYLVPMRLQKMYPNTVPPLLEMLERTGQCVTYLVELP